MERASASISAHACSATLMLFAPGRVDDENAARAGGADVDVVHAGAGAGDHLQVRRRSEQCGIDFGRAANEQRVGVRQIDSQLGGRPAGAGIDRPGLFSAKQFESGKGKVIGYHDFHRE